MDYCLTNILFPSISISYFAWAAFNQHFNISYIFFADEQKLLQFTQEEKEIKEENLRLQRRLLLEQERREALSRHLSESESSLEMDDERQFNEMTAHGLRPRTISSPIPYSPNPARPISPGKCVLDSGLGR